MEILDDHSDSPSYHTLRKKPSQKFHMIYQNQLKSIIEDQVYISSKESIFTILGIRQYVSLSKRYPHLIYIAGLIFRLAWIGVFVYFMQNIFINLYYDQKFISLSPDAGICQNIARPWTTSIAADYYGNWDTSKEFDPNFSLFVFNLKNFVGSKSDGLYSKILDQFTHAISLVGSTMSQNDLSLNLVYWSNWHYVIYLDNNSPQEIITVSDAAYIILADKQQGTIANIDSDCHFGASSIFYSQYTGVLKMQFDMSTFYNYSTCKNLVNPSLLGYDPLTTDNLFELKLNVYSLFTALAIAHKIIGNNTYNDFNFIDVWIEAYYQEHNKIYRVERIYDQNYANMDPIYCIGPKNEPYSNWNCVIEMGGSYGIPFFHHSLSNYTYPTTCDCQNNDVFSGGKSYRCNQLDLLSGVMIYDISKNNTKVLQYDVKFQGFIPLIEFFYSYPCNSGSSATYDIFPAAWTAIYGQNNNYFKNRSWRNESYAFANTESFGTPTIIVFQSYTEDDRTITIDKYQLNNGSCNNAIESSYFSKLKQFTWGSLVEDYYSCTMSLSDSLTNAFGVASSTTSLIVPVFIIFLLYSASSILSHTEKKKKKKRKSRNENSESKISISNENNTYDNFLKTKLILVQKYTSNHDDNNNLNESSSEPLSTREEMLLARVHTLEMNQEYIRSLLEKNDHIFGWTKLFEEDDDYHKHFINKKNAMSFPSAVVVNNDDSSEK